MEAFNFSMDTLRAEPAFSSSTANSGVGNKHESVIQHPVDSFSFGWLDAISISQDTTKSDSFFVFFAQPNEDPWSTHAPTLTFYHLEANSTAGVEEDRSSNTQSLTSHALSETFLASVPLSASASPTSTSSSTSMKVAVGRNRTALWLSPRPGEWDATGLVQMDLNRQGDWPVRTRRNFLGGDLVWASFRLTRSKAKPETDDDENWTSAMEGEGSKAPVIMNRILSSCGEDWTTIGYDEETGRVALGRRDGYITFLCL